jgi:cytochrome c oxidase subunit 3
MSAINSSADLGANVLLKDTRRERDEFPGEPWRSHAAGSHERRRASSASIALWLFMMVATTLFALFIVSYAMRMGAADWHPIAMPWQLWLSTALLLTGSVVLQVAARQGRRQRARMLLLAGGVCAFAFLGVQWWAWQALLAARVMPVGNPAGSFFYLLTAMHGLHVIGGLVAWGATMRHMRWSASADAIALCARYWHFLLAVWVVLFAVLGGLTPEIVRAICGTS